MKKLTLTILLTSLLVLVATPAAPAADVKPALPFTDHMVLQRDVPVPVWGTADAGQKVTVILEGISYTPPRYGVPGTVLNGKQTKTAVADKDGNWALKLDAMPAGGPFEMTVEGAGAAKVTLKDVLVGEVWLCSGQSNMNMWVRSANNAAAEIAEANYPQIRMMTDRGAWTVCTPETVRSFSATGYFFGRELNKALKVPVGLLHESVGGTSARLWTPWATIKAIPELKQIEADYDKAVADLPRQQAAYEEALAKWQATTQAVTTQPATGRAPAAPRKPTVQKPGALYDTMIQPVIPYAIRGAIWYQGETDSGRPAEYRTLFPSMVQAWRKNWGQGDFPFLSVQLPNYSGDFTAIRAVQEACLSLPNTGMAVTIDIGDTKDIHPKNKQDVGKRLALVALAKVYGQKVVCAGPMYGSMAVEGAKVRVKFKELGGGLVAKAAAEANAPADAKAGEVLGFMVAGEDKKFVPAQAKIDGDSVVVWSEAVAKPVAVRYAWEADPKVNLYNKEGLPAAPFRTDDWQ
jgi:sialate O-acetylesterase